MKGIMDMIKTIRTTGSIKPSSMFLVKKILKKIDFSHHIKILQLGFGTGVFTKEILTRSNNHSELIIFEVNKHFKKYYTLIKYDKAIKHDNVTYIEDSAENISNHFKAEYFDIIISTLPFTLFPAEMAKNIRNEIRKSLKTGGKFLQYQYSLQSKKKFEQTFGKKIKLDFALCNIPPAFIFEIEK